jgi:lysine biosynthesis protein LysW
VVRCPKCATEIDVDEDEVEEGEILACPECETEMEVVQIHPVKVNAISEDDDDDERTKRLTTGTILRRMTTKKTKKRKSEALFDFFRHPLSLLAISRIVR